MPDEPLQNGQNGHFKPYCPGGPGEVVSISDMALAARAERERWPLTPETRRTIHDKMLAIVQGEGSERARVAAAKVLVAADAINTRREGLASGKPESQSTTNISNTLIIQAIDAAEQDIKRLRQERADGKPTG
jgi:hypothetical protein